LNILPFAALKDDSDDFLLQHYTINYLTSGRDLIRLTEKLPPKQGIVVFADPDYGGNQGSPESVVSSRPNCSEVLGSQKASVRFQRLPCTADEARAIKAAMGGATLKLEEKATKTELLNIDSPVVLHLATHGFIESDAKAQVETETGPRVMDTNFLAGLETEISLWRARIALAGANSTLNEEE